MRCSPRSKALGVYGTKERSVINSANREGIAAIVKQQFEVGAQVKAGGLMPMLEPEVNIKSETRAECDAILLEEILKNLDALPEGTRQVMLKLSLPVVPGTFDSLVNHPKRAARRRALWRLQAPGSVR
jgi:fructose-bisphosphate aldolase class I